MHFFQTPLQLCLNFRDIFILKDCKITMRDYLNEFTDYLKTVKKSSANTIESYVRDIKAFLSYAEINSLDILILSADDIREYINSLEKKGKTHSTLVRNLASIRCFYEFLIYTDSVLNNPTKNIKLKKAETKLPEILTQKEVDILLSQPNVSTHRGCRDKAMLELLYATGLRVTELIDLNVDDVNLQINIVMCHSSKSERIVPVYSSAIKSIENYLANVRNALVSDKSEKALFVNMNGTRMTRQGFWKIIKSYADMGGIDKKITPHTIRHSFATHLLENGAGIKDIKEMLGHSGISSTQVYSQIIKHKYENSYTKFHPKAGN